MSDFTIVIQGPQSASSASAANAHRYLQFGDVIVSHWAGEDASGFNGLPVKILAQPRPPKSYNNAQNIYYQCLSTLKGLNEADTKFCIKVRSDEAYTDLSPLIKKVMESPTKLVTCNIYFRKDREYKFHPSDHVMASNTESLRKTFSMLRTMLEAYDPSALSLSAEQKICTCFLKANNASTDHSKSVKTMKAWCDVVPIDQMGAFVWSSYGASSRVDKHYIRSIDDI